jgi:flagellar biosynthesis/type III secretory pathway chaperone
MHIEESKELKSVEADISALRQLLLEEFEVLKRRDLDRLKLLEENKTDLLLRLETHGPSFLRAEQLSAGWVQAREDLRACRDLHFKNLQLLRRQMDVVQGTLQAMVGDSDPLPMIYDRSGQVGGGRYGRPWQSA